MKHKGLIATLIAITLLTAFAIFSKENGRAPKSSENQVVRIGILQFVTHEALDAINKGIVDGLADAGYDGTTVQLTQLNAEADQSKIKTMSDQLVKSNDLVIGIATPAAQGLANATADVPVVMGAISDPVGAKLVTDLQKPEGNVTGTSNIVPVKQTVDLIGKLTPNVKKIGVLYASSEDNSISQVKEFRQSAQEQGFEVIEYAVPSSNEITATMGIIVDKVDALFIPQDNTIASAFPTVIGAANEAKIPVYSSVDTMVAQGSLAAISQSQYELGRETAKIAVKLLAGKEVNKVPVAIIDTGKPLVNPKAAELLGLMLPKDIMEEADIVKLQE
ncbi:tryptophan ABC transporter substrate-binding protein [Streptococcus hillyeri]|uniref:ABC transporter substrate-binding protein n=1 Tax=Streptococcus hillyeri TaxID=2282420 RepID=A0A3L9DLT0_9STRE|nr:tryptophan ABC transporter substrate-binding protein [Streptococcus hillyeri]RLY01138.1 ABC transporter substrate-binding protein [Streptococcus hillyeri]